LAVKNEAIKTNKKKVFHEVLTLCFTEYNLIVWQLNYALVESIKKYCPLNMIYNNYNKTYKTPTVIYFTGYID